jgi:hypothetical protein
VAFDLGSRAPAEEHKGATRVGDVGAEVTKFCPVHVATAAPKGSSVRKNRVHAQTRGTATCSSDPPRAVMKRPNGANTRCPASWNGRLTRWRNDMPAAFDATVAVANVTVHHASTTSSSPADDRRP